MPVVKDVKEIVQRKRMSAFRYFGGSIPPEIFEKVDGTSYETAEEKCGAICAFLCTSNQKKTSQIKACIDEFNESISYKIKFQPIFGDDEIVTFTKSAKHHRHHLYKTIKAQRDAKIEGKDSTYTHLGKKSAEDEADEEALQYAEDDDDDAGSKPSFLDQYKEVKASGKKMGTARAEEIMQSEKRYKKVRTLGKQLGTTLTEEISKPVNPRKRASVPVLNAEVDIMPSGKSKRVKKSNGKNMGGAPAVYSFDSDTESDKEEEQPIAADVKMEISAKDVGG